MIFKPHMKMNPAWVNPAPWTETRGLDRTYTGIQAFQTLDPQVQKNSICGFLGPYGAGKITAIKLLLGLAWPASLEATQRNGKVRRQANSNP